jgi:Stage II sporulation protein E (SpoIIE)/GAF domain
MGDMNFTSSLAQASTALMARFTDDLHDWLDCNWAMAMACTGEGLVPLCVAGRQPDLRSALAYTESAVIHQQGNLIRAPEPESCEQEHLGWTPSIICPVYLGEDLVGVLAFGSRSEDRPYTDAEAELILEFASHISQLLSDARLMETERSQVRAIQDRMLPYHRGEVKDLDYYGERHGGKEIGTSFFDFIPLRASKLALCIGEIIGQGAPAGILMAGAQVSVRSLALAHEQEAAAVVRELNHTLCEISPEDYYTTLFYAHIDAVKREMHYVNGGHEAALLIRQNGRAERLDNTGTLLGLSERAIYRTRTITLEPGDTLVAMGRRAGGSARPEEWVPWEASAVGAARMHPNARSSDLARYIVEAIDFHAGEAVCAQDTTVVVVRFKGAEMVVRPLRPAAAVMACAA